MKVSIRQISQATGYSPATVSNALNQKRGVNRQTSETIFNKAKELGYKLEKDVSKIRFVTYRKNGLIIDGSQIFPAMIEGVERKAKELGYETTFSHLSCESETFEKDLVNILNDKTSVIILLGTEMMEEDYKLFDSERDRIVVLDGWSNTMRFSSVLINNTDAALQAVNYLIKKGHKDIGYLKGKYRINAFRYRELGYEIALYQCGIKRNEEYTVTLGTTPVTAYEDMKKYLKMDKELPSAFFADNDVIAIAALKALNEKGIRVPQDVSIVGFDDIGYSSITIPAITTMHVLKREMGEVAVRKVHDSTETNAVVEKIQICTEFIERDSVRDLRHT